VVDDLDDLDDEALLAELAGVLRPYTVPPPEVVEAAKQSFTWRTIDAELAALTHDSLLDEEPVAVRAAAQPRILTFETDGLTVEVEVDETPGARRLLGQLVPAGPADLELRSAAGEPVAGQADELGRFVLALPAERQRVSLRCVRPDGAVETAWVAL
jgi:hypothetical protein